jgi:prephenate dehydratase
LSEISAINHIETGTKMAREQPSVAYLGPKASYTSQMACSLFPESHFYLTPRRTIEDVFEAVQSGSVDRGVIPLENSSNGPVLATLDLFADRGSLNPNVYISGEGYLKVDHCLLGYPPTINQSSPPTTPSEAGTERSFESLPLHSFDHIKHVYSHPQALGQCEQFLSKYLPHAVRHEVSSTAAAAHIAAQDPLRASACIGSAVIAKETQLSLSILSEKIQDVPDNSTRFVVLKRFAPQWHYEPAWTEELLHHESNEKRKMLVSFSVQHSRPGTLADALVIFKRYDLNLTSISARPSREHAWHYRHFAEFEWRWDQETGACPVDEAIRDLSLLATDWKCHGAWATTLKW